MIVNYISNTLNLIIYMFDAVFNNNVTATMLYIFILIVIITMFKRIVGIK